MSALGELEIAPIPAGWEIKTIHDLCEIWSGGTPAKSEPAFWNGDIPWVSGKDLKSPELDDSIDHISAEGLDAGSRLAPAGAVFVLVRGMGLARDLPIAVAKRPMAFNQDIKALVSRTGLSGSFLRSAIYHAKDRLLARIVPSAHGTMTLNLDDVESLAISVPTNPTEAEAIASILELIQQAISTEKRQLKLATDLKGAATRMLLTRGVRGEAAKETEIGPVPESWTVVPVAKLGAVKGGKRMPKGVSLVREDTGRPYIRVTDFKDHSVQVGGILFVPRGYEDAIRRYRISSRDVYISIAGSIGLVGQVPERLDDANLTENAAKIVFEREYVVPRYVMYALAGHACQEQIARATAKNAQPKLALTRIEQLLVPLPATLDEQREIVAGLDAIGRKIDLHRRKHALLEELFKTLLHKMMTGEILVADLDLSALNRSAPVAEVAA